MFKKKKFNIVNVTPVSDSPILATRHGLETSISLDLIDNSKNCGRFVLAIAVRFYVADEVDFVVPDIRINCSKSNCFIDGNGQRFALNEGFITDHAEYLIELIINAQSFEALENALIARQNAINHAYY